MTRPILVLIALFSLAPAVHQEPSAVVDETTIIATAVERAQSEDARRFNIAQVSDLVAPWAKGDREFYSQFDVGGEATPLPSSLFASARTNNERALALDDVATRVGIDIARTACAGRPLLHASRRPGLSADGTEASRHRDRRSGQMCGPSNRWRHESRRNVLAEETIERVARGWARFDVDYIEVVANHQMEPTRLTRSRVPARGSFVALSPRRKHHITNA